MDGHVVRIDEMKSGDADEDTTEKLAQDGRLSEALRDLTEDLGGHEDGDQSQQKVFDAHEAVSISTLERRDGLGAGYRLLARIILDAVIPSEGWR